MIFITICIHFQSQLSQGQFLGKNRENLRLVIDKINQSHCDPARDQTQNLLVATLYPFKIHQLYLLGHSNDLTADV